VTRYRAEVASGGTGADVVDTEAKPMREVIARCGTLGHAKKIAAALNQTERWRSVVVAAYDRVAFDEGRAPEQIMQDLREDLHDALGGVVS
jgi:hypothetical protein